MQIKPSKCFMTEEGGSPGGGSANPHPAAPSAAPTAPEQPKYVTEEKLGEALQAFQNGFFANARKAGLLKPEKPAEPAPSPQAAAQGKSSADPMAVLALRDAFDDATSEMKLTKGQRSLLRDHVMLRCTAGGEVESIVSDYVSRAGWNTEPSVVTPSAAQPAAPAAPAATTAPEPARPQPAIAPSAPSGHGLPMQNGITDLFALTPQQRKDLTPQGVRKVLEQLAQIGNDQAGIPQRPKPPSQR